MSSSFFPRCVVTICFALGLFPKCLAQTGDIAKDSLLQKPISIKLKIAQLPDALKQISKLAGVRLASVEPINDLKITVFVKDEPAGLVLAKIANVLGCEWKPDGDLYRLSMSSDERRHRERYVESEDEIAQKEISEALNQLATDSAAGHGPLRGTGTGSGPTYEPINPTLTPLGLFLSGLSAGQVSAFWKGDVVVGSARRTQATSPIDSTAATPPGATPGRLRPSRIPPASAPMFVQFDPLLYQVQFASRGGVMQFDKRPARIVTQFVPEGKLADLPFGKEVMAWDQAIPTDGDLAKITVDPVVVQSHYSNHLVSVGDLMEKAFDVTGVPVVMDAFRVPASLKGAYQVSGSLTEWIAKVKAESHLFTRFEDGFILARHGGFWRLRRFETSENVLAPLEAKAEKDNLTLDDYSRLAAKLTPEQTRPFILRAATLTKFDTRPLQFGLPALQFYASLDSRAIAQSMKDGIAYPVLGSAQRQLFDSAALEGVFLGAASPSFGDALVRLATTGDSRGLGFIVRSGMLNVKSSVAIDGQSLLFGASTSEATTYSIPLDNPVVRGDGAARDGGNRVGGG